ncbi:hypothetical protein DL96DRAFT_504781 [Flagelloscypha sp. PMI_526]|nr:hypothetical protein DL96DRAFT_504781 [Flagelloscypha sp. PMI_526]
MSSGWYRRLSFRFGYPIEKEYPWRFTTTITLVLFTALTAFFVMLNIPLAAYDIGHEFTSDPNTTQTSPQTPFANFFPNMLRPSAGEFQPQILMPGDKVRTNLTLFEYEIIDAAALFTEWTHGPPVGSFEFRNQPLSNCDVGNVTVSVRKGERAHVDAEVLCWFPSYFRMRVQYDHGPTMLVNQRFVIHQSGTEMATFFRSQIDMALTDVENSWDRLRA